MSIYKCNNSVKRLQVSSDTNINAVAIYVGYNKWWATF